LPFARSHDSGCHRESDSPATKKFAVKVINHYGEEVLKVCAI